MSPTALLADDRSDRTLSPRRRAETPHTALGERCRVRDDRPSRTAMLVAAGRAIASRTRSAAANPDDWQALSLLPKPLRVLVRAVVGVDRFSPTLSRMLLQSTAGLIDHVALRGHMIDGVVRDAISAGCGQVVLVGAGLDTRAQRLPELSGTAVYEVDHPATQADKRRRIVAGGVVPGASVTFVPVNLAVVSLADALGEAGHHPQAPTLWIWEGVIAYLTRSQVVATVADIAARSAPGSQLVASYRERGARWPRPVQWFSNAILPLLGESLGDALAQDELAAILSAHGLEPEWDLAPSAWLERVGSGERSRPYTYERLFLARRST